jgi:S-adenosylmethionine-dependent methyltransferase
VTDAEVAKLYDLGAAEEWARLDERRMEFGVTCAALDEFLPPAPARILDVGCGPGRYALRLAERGYSVSVLDLSQQSLNLALEKASNSGVRFDEVVCGTATDLGTFPSGHFDAVLLMGPLYHLKSTEHRSMAVREALRTARSKGLLFSTHLTRYSVVRYAAKVRPEQLAQMPTFIDSILTNGTGEAQDGFLRTCYCADPPEIRPFMEAFGLRTLEMVGCEGVVAEVEERLNQLPEVEFESWVALNYKLGRNPELLAASAHILHIGQKAA